MKPNICVSLRNATTGVALIILAGCAANQAYRSGQQELGQGHYEKGIAQLQEAVKLDPDNPQFRATLRTASEQSVNRLLLDADRHLNAKRLDDAEVLYRRTLVIEENNARALTSLEAVARARRHLVLMQEAQRQFTQKDFDAALGKVRRVLTENPQHAEAAMLLAQIDEAQVRDAHAPLVIKTRHIKPVNMQFRDANIRLVFEALAKTTGLNFIFDNDVKPSLRATIFVNQVKVEDAIELILAQSQLAKKVLNDNTLLIYPATAQKFKEYQEQIVKGFYLTNLDAKKAQGMLKTMLDVATVYVDEHSNILFVRDAPETVRMVEKMIAASDLAEPEVMLEVEVLEIKRGTLQQIGIDYPDKVSFSLTDAAGAADKLTWENLKTVNASRIGVSPLGVAIDIAKQDSNTKVLASPRIRARSREKAKIHIGDRVPVITTSVTPGLAGTSVVTASSVQYLDVGLKLEIEPTVMLDGDVAIKTTLEVSSIVKEVSNGTAGSVAYQIGTRNATTLLRLKDGETQVLAGLISDEERNTANKIPGLGDLPLLGRLFSTQKDDATKTEIVLSITPHIVRTLKRPDADTSEFWFGTVAGKRGQPLTVQSVVRGEPLAPEPASAVPPALVVPGAAKPEAGMAPLATPPADAVKPVAAAPPARGPITVLLQGPPEVKVGEEFEAQVVIKAGQPVHGMQFELGFENSVLEVISVEAGTTIPQLEANQYEGRIEITLAPAAEASITGSAELVRVKYRVLAEKARSPLSMRNLQLFGINKQRLSASTVSSLTLVAKP